MAGRRDRRKRQRRRRIPLLLAVVVCAVAAAAYAAIGRHAAPRAARARTPAAKRTPAARLAPPGPIPGYLLIADRGNDRMLLVDGAKRIYWRYPRPSGSPPMPFHFDDDTFFGPRTDRIISNQEDQDTIQVVTFPSGRVAWRYGHVNVKSGAPGYLNTPDDAYLLPNGLVSVADAYNCRVLFISPAHRIVRQYGTTGRCEHAPPRLLGAVNGATPLADGGTLVSEITGSWIDDISAGGKLRWAVRAPVSYPSDPQLLAPNRILLADYAHPGHALVMTSSGRVLWRYGPSSGPGELDHPSLAMRIAPGLVAINDDYRHRIVVVDMHTNRIVWQYGHTDVPGTGPGYLNTPDGMDLLPTATAQALPAVRALLRASARHAPAAAAASGPRLAVTVPYRLPAPVERAVAVAAAGGVVIAGGLDAGGTSTDGVFLIDPATGRLTRLGSVPQPFHDAAGAVLGSRVVVFGGGTGQSSPSVQAFDLRTHTGSVVGRLPQPLSDISAAVVGRTVYLLGGWNGRTYNSTVYATSDGVHFRTAGRLPAGLRYAAVAAADGKIVVAGGNTPAGPSSAVYLFDPSNGTTATLGRLPQPLAHATAVAVDGLVYVVGAHPGAAVVDLAHRTVRSVPSAPALDDAAAVVVGGRALLIGGSRAGRTSDAVVSVRPTSAAARR